MRRNRLIFYTAWILSLVGISFVGGVVSYGLFCALTLLPAVMYAYLIFVLIKFSFYQELSAKYVTCRTPVTYYFTLQNETAFAFARVRVLFYEFGVDHGELDQNAEYELMPHSGHTVSTNIVCRYRGEYQIGVRKVVITDFLHLFSITYKNPNPFKVNVLPAVEFPSGDMEDVRALFAGNSANRVPETRDIPVRPYVEGDPLRSISWKATARTQKLMTAQMTSEEHSSVHILLDTKRYSERPEEYLPAEDSLLTRLITLVIFYAEQHTCVDVCYSSQGLQQLTLKSMRDFDAFYAAISAVMFTPDSDIEAVRSEVLGRSRIDGSDIIILRDPQSVKEVGL